MIRAALQKDVQRRLDLQGENCVVECTHGTSPGGRDGRSLERNHVNITAVLPATRSAFCSEEACAP